MSKKDDFKQFAALHPELLKYVQSGEKTWQNFFEMYDIYGDDENRWSEYIKKEEKEADERKGLTNLTSSLPEIIKNIDLSSIQKHIGTAQKALGFVQELTTKSTVAGTALGAAAASATKGPKTPRPVNKFFED